MARAVDGTKNKVGRRHKEHIHHAGPSGQRVAQQVTVGRLRNVAAKDDFLQLRLAADDGDRAAFQGAVGVEISGAQGPVECCDGVDEDCSSRADRGCVSAKRNFSVVVVT